jgi:hypothetical protein
MPTMMRSALCLVAVLGGCGDNHPGGPSLEIAAPERGLIADSTTVTVQGRAVAGLREVAQVRVNGRDADVDDQGRFSVALELAPGTNLIETVAVDLGGGESRDVRSVSVGERAGAARLESGVVFHIGTVGLGRTANMRLKPLLDNTAVTDAMTAGPIADVANPGCPAQNDVISLASIDPPVANVSAYTKLGGVAGELLFMPIVASLSATYADENDGCAVKAGDFAFETLELHYAFSIDLAGGDGAFTASLTEDLRLYDHELFTTNGDIEIDVFDRVSANVEAHMADALIPAGTDEYIRLFETWLEGFSRTRTAAVAGASIEIRQTPDQVSESGDGLTVGLDLELAEIPGGTWVPTPTDPVAPVTRRGAIAVSDDAVDQVLGGIWAGGGFTAATNGGATLEMLVPPSVGPGGELVIGDWIARDGDVEVALVGTAELIPAIGAVDISLGPGEIALELQLLSGEMSRADLEALAAEATLILAERIADSLSALGVELVAESAPMLAAELQGGYVVMDTFLPPPLSEF